MEAEFSPAVRRQDRHETCVRVGRSFAQQQKILRGKPAEGKEFS
jgi:hypothetical protein